MTEFLQTCFGNGMLLTYIEALLDTLKLTLISTLLAYLIGTPIGVLLYCTSPDGIFPNRAVNSIVGFVVNIIRSVPFIIALVMLQPLSKLIVGTKIGDNAFMFYLIISAAPFVARMIESSLKEVDRGVIEAAQSMGSNNWQIITKVLLPEAKPSLIVGGAIAITTILGYTPMAYLVAGGGLGQLAIQYGLYRFNPEIMYISSLLLIVLVEVIQTVFNRVSKTSDKRIRKKG